VKGTDVSLYLCLVERAYERLAAVGEVEAHIADEAG
jgi:hypothetical protein